LLLGAEAEVGRVPYPKLVLEMSFIKLATLTPVVAAGELLDRIDVLERRLNDRPQPPGSGGPSSGGKTPTPARREASRAEHATSSADATTVPGGGGWEEFLHFVSKEKITLLPYLKSSQTPSCDGAVLALAVPGGYYYDYLTQHTRQVEEMAQRFFGRALRVTVSVAGTAAEPAPAPPESGAALHAAALGNPVVRAAVEILGGEVQEVRSRARREKGKE
jgi:DNA polymerase-3 subunit gamma/tau